MGTAHRGERPSGTPTPRTGTASSSGLQARREALAEPGGPARALDAIFDSHLTGGWNALYMSAFAEELDDVERGIGVFSRRSVEQGFPPWTSDQVLPPARHRLYRATVSEWFVPDTHDERHPVSPSAGG